MDQEPNAPHSGPDDVQAGQPETPPIAEPTVPAPLAPGAVGGTPVPSETTRPVAPNSPPPDPFDPDNLRLSQDFTNTGGVKKHITSVPVRKPINDEWFRVHPATEFTLDTLILELKGSRDCHLIAPGLRDELATEPTVTPRRLRVAMNRDGTVFLWPLKFTRAGGRLDSWSESALEAAATAQDAWVRIQADMGLGAYVFYTPLGELPPPTGPTCRSPSSSGSDSATATSTRAITWCCVGSGGEV